MACREVLLTLNRKGLLKLPPRQTSAHNEKRNRFIPVIQVDQLAINRKLAELPPVELKSVRNTDHDPLYNSLIQQHHYLGYRQIIGNHLKYIAFCGGRPVAQQIFDLDRCWMKGSKNSRWLFAAMGLTIQMHQLIAYQKGKSTWKIQEEILG